MRIIFYLLPQIPRLKGSRRRFQFHVFYPIFNLSHDSGAFPKNFHKSGYEKENTKQK